MNLVGLQRGRCAAALRIAQGDSLYKLGGTAHGLAGHESEDGKQLLYNTVCHHCYGCSEHINPITVKMTQDKHISDETQAGFSWQLCPMQPLSHSLTHSLLVM